MDRLEKGKSVNTAYSTKDLTPNSANLRLQLMWNMGCHRIISLGSHHRQAQFGHPGPNRLDRSVGPVRPVPRRLDRSDRSIRPVRPVLWCWPRRPLLHSRRFQVQLPLAEQMNWRVLYRRTLLDHTANHLFYPLCHKMFGTI